MSDYIPPEVIEKILLRLPSKFLIQCSCICKSWYSLICSPDFISMYTHFNFTNKDHNAHFIMRHYARTYGTEIFSLHLDDDLSFSNFLDCPVMSNRGYVDIVGSSNGLICLADLGTLNSHDFSILESPIFLWNPSLGISRSIQVKHLCPWNEYSLENWYLYNIIVGFGFDSKNDDYKVVRIVCHIGYVEEVVIFALSENCWRSTKAPLTLPNCCISECPQAFFNGKIHWIGYYRKTKNTERKLVVASFHVSNESFGELGMPVEVSNEKLDAEKCIFCIQECRKSLTLIRYDEKDGESFNRCCIWVMKEYGVAGSWMKIFTISPYKGFSKILDIRRNGQILLTMNYGELASYDVESKSRDRLHIYGDTFSFDYVDTFVESLALLKSGQPSSSIATSQNHISWRVKQTWNWKEHE